jgi:hypothetical protein
MQALCLDGFLLGTCVYIEGRECITTGYLGEEQGQSKGNLRSHNKHWFNLFKRLSKDEMKYFFYRIYSQRKYRYRNSTQIRRFSRALGSN